MISSISQFWEMSALKRVLTLKQRQNKSEWKAKYTCDSGALKDLVKPTGALKDVYSFY